MALVYIDHYMVFHLRLHQTKKAMVTNEYTFITSHFDGHADALKQYTQHCPLQHVQGYTGSHWMPPSSNQLLRIAPAAARATGKQTTMKKYTYFAGNFDGHGNALVRYRAHCLMAMVEVQGFTRSHWMLPLSKFYVQ
jgi:hypothetical protein